MVYGETFLINIKFYAKTLTKLHDLTVCSVPATHQKVRVVAWSRILPS
jgi:hypothetical protein